jgi:hypothetical protein
MYNLCRISRTRQEAAAVAGIIPHLTALATLPANPADEGALHSLSEVTRVKACVVTNLCWYLPVLRTFMYLCSIWTLSCIFWLVLVWYSTFGLLPIVATLMSARHAVVQARQPLICVWTRIHERRA